MNEDFSALVNFDGITRLFPLPNVVFFPHVLLPLHIFEQRYRDMTTDALATDRLITLALPAPGWEDEYEGRPALYPVGCMGRIIQEQRLADGRYHLVLRGLTRVRIVEELPPDARYRVARVEVLQDEAVADPNNAVRLAEDLRRGMFEWAAGNNSPLEPLHKLFGNSFPLGVLCDILGFAVSFTAETKQGLLEELDVERRARRLLDALRALCRESQPKPWPFPPRFSAN